MNDMNIQRTKFTRQDYMALPEGFPAQLIRGQLVKEPAPTPWHQVLVRRVADMLERLAHPDRILFSPIDLFVDDENILQPDVVLLPEGTRIGPDLMEMPVPELMVEVLSPATRKRDREVKTGIYLEVGVAEVWLVDPESRVVELMTREGLVTPAESTVLPGFLRDPASLFRE